MNHTCSRCGNIDIINPAAALGSVTSDKKAATSKANGAAPVKLGSRPRGRPRNLQEWVVYCIDGRGVLKGPRTAQDVRQYGYFFTVDPVYYWKFPNEKQAANKARIVNKHIGWTGQGINNMACRLA